MDNLQLHRWEKRLENRTELILPSDYPRPVPVRVVDAEAQTCLISQESSKAILQLSMDCNCTPFSVILAAFAILLHKISGETDITIGSSSSSTNPLVLRMNIAHSASIREIIDTVLETETDASQDEVPFAALVEYLSMKHGNTIDSMPPLFKVRLFNATDISPETLSSSLSSSSCDLTIFISQQSTLRRLLPIQMNITYNSVLFSESRITIMLEQLQFMLQQASQNLDSPINKYSMISAGTKNILPDPCANLEWDLFHGAITDIFTRNAEMHPKKICVVESIANAASVRTFTYEQINLASNILANYLILNGIGREDVVVLYSYRGVDLVIAVIAVLKAGATFSVIDPAYPPPRQNIYLSVARPVGIVILKKAGELDEVVEKYIQSNLSVKCRISGLYCNDEGSLHGGLNSEGLDIFAVAENRITENPNVQIGPDSIGTLSFTSGSTGIPKGVRGRHFSLTHFYPWMKKEFEMTENERFTMLSGIAHDPIQRDIFTPMFLGAQLHIPSSEDIGSPGRLAEWMGEQKITITHLTPAMGQLLSANATAQIPTLRHAFFVGDVLTKRDVVRLQHLAFNTTCVNMFGTTETQRAVSFLKIPPSLSNPGYLMRQKEIMAAGRGMKNVQLLVLNAGGMLAGVGEVGEIYVRSSGLAEGYLSLPEVTAEKFLNNPFSTTEIFKPAMQTLPYFKGIRDRMYRTGDMGRYQPDGIVECTGRSDDQVKIRGFRIELGEIDTHLSQHPGIRENVTLVRRDKNEEKTIVTYFVPIDSHVDISEFVDDIREYLKQKLPSYAIPSVFAALSRMPLTPNGKVDKNVLPFPDTAIASSTQAQKQHNALFTDTELTLVDVWAAVLSIDRSIIGIKSNFFDLGGHSISATRLVFSVRKVFAANVPLGMVYQSPTLQEMAKDIEFLVCSDLNFSASSNNLLAVNSENPSRPSTDEDISFDYAADLDNVDDINICKGTLKQSPISRLNSKPLNIFLTGVTGFLGAFILRSIFTQHPNSLVWCLVRAKSNEEGHNRIIENCSRHLIQTNDWGCKIKACAGDLSASNFGLCQERWTEMCSVIDLIIHNGALVHWVYPYQKLRSPNVLGTKTALLMATTIRLKPLHFVSSTSVLDTDHFTKLIGVGKSVLESDDLEGSRQGLGSGYGQTKWVAEKLVMRARSRGVPCSIIRPGYIVGDSKTGGFFNFNSVTNTDDFIWRLVKGCIQLGEVPRISNVVNMCNVDYVSDLVVKVALSEEGVKLGVFHTWNSSKFKFDDLFTHLISNRFPVVRSEYVLWRTALMDFTLQSGDHALFPLLHFVLDDLPTSTKSPELDDLNSRKVLLNSNINCADMAVSMPLYLGYLIHVGFLESITPNLLPSLESWKSAIGIVGRSGN